MKYNTERKQLYCTVDDVVSETSITSAELQEKFGDNFKDVIEKDISRQVNRYIYQLHKGFDVHTQKRVLDALIYNDKNLQAGIKNAIIEHVKGAFYAGMDLNVYSGATGMDAQKSVPDSVLEELRIGGLLELSGKFEVSDKVLDELEARIPTGADVIV